jgi:two-component system, sensor histidine kinase
MTALPHRHRWLIGVAAALLLMALAAVAWLQVRQQRALDATVRYQDDYLQVSLAQLQVEYLRLRQTLMVAAQSGAPDRATVQLRYDVFASRVDLLAGGRATRLLTSLTDFRQALGSSQSFIEEADRVLGPTPERAFDAAAARHLLERMAPLDAQIQALVMGASHAVSARVAQQYDVVRDQGRLGTVLTALLALVSVGFV